MSKPTINDIARLTGLSKGTVDRVLHKRGEVSKKSTEKVMAVIKELGYEPNLYASLLARGEEKLIALILPTPDPGDYWAIAASGEEKAMAEVKSMALYTKHFNYDQYSADSFREACAKVLASNPAGVVIAPMFPYEAKNFAQELKARDIPFVFVDTKVDVPGYLAFFGIPAYKSGYLCADLVTSAEPVKEVLAVRVMRDKQRQSDPTVERRSGFMDYMLEHNPNCTIRNLFIDPSDPVATDDALAAFFREFRKIRHIVMFNSRIHLIVPFLERNPIPGLRVVGYDNLNANTQALQKGLVTMLIAQHPDEQVHHAVLALADYIVFNRLPAQPDNYMHMDILMRYNLENY